MKVHVAAFLAVCSVLLGCQDILGVNPVVPLEPEFDPCEVSGDEDGDGVCDDVDRCAAGDDGVDGDDDGIPDACDLCLAGDDAIDGDGDGVADACDSCPLDDPDDTDDDGVCDSVDLCPGSDDGQDEDNDGIPDGCDQCPGSDDSQDQDSDGIPDDCDECPVGLCPASCGVILSDDARSPDGTYLIDPDGNIDTPPFEVFCDMTTEGGGWTRFNWLAQDYPTGADPLEQALEECDVNGTICRGRIPAAAEPIAVMVLDVTSGEYAAWRFNGGIISNAVLGAFRDKQEFCARDQGAFAPFATTSTEAFCGTGLEGGCDSFYYKSGTCLTISGGFGLNWDGDTGFASSVVKYGATNCDATEDDHAFLNGAACRDEHGEIYYR